MGSKTTIHSIVLLQVEQQLKQQIASVEAQSGRQITIHGLSCDAYIRRQWDRFHNRKEMQKRQRVFIRVFSRTFSIKQAIYIIT